MINIRIIVIVFSLLFSLQSYAQETISGKLTSESGENIANAIITINSISNQVVAFGNSNQKGDYSISTHSNDSLLLKIKTLGYKPITN
jgi:hypothetical protein